MTSSNDLFRRTSSQSSLTFDRYLARIIPEGSRAVKDEGVETPQKKFRESSSQRPMLPQ